MNEVEDRRDSVYLEFDLWLEPYSRKLRVDQYAISI